MSDDSWDPEAAKADWMRAKTAELWPKVQEYRLGSRAETGGYQYTLVALRVDTQYGILPLYIGDDHVNGELLEPDGVEDLQPAPDDPEKAAAARAWAASSREYLTLEGNDDVLFDLPASVDQFVQFLRFCDADRAWRVAEGAMRRAAADRSLAIAQVVWTDGTQTSASRILALHQSNVSRACAAADVSSTMAP